MTFASCGQSCPPVLPHEPTGPRRPSHSTLSKFSQDPRPVLTLSTAPAAQGPLQRGAWVLGRPSRVSRCSVASHNDSVKKLSSFLLLQAKPRASRPTCRETRHRSHRTLAVPHGLAPLPVRTPLPSVSSPGRSVLDRTVGTEDRGRLAATTAWPCLPVSHVPRERHHRPPDPAQGCSP